MSGSADTAETIAIVAGGGRLPQFVTADALRRNHQPIVFAIAGEAEPASFAPAPVYSLRWGEIGRLFKLAEENGCSKVVLVGSVGRRPNYLKLRPDMGAVKLLPRILKIMGNRDSTLLDGIAEILEERGLNVVSPLDVAPDLALGEGCHAGEIDRQSAEDIEAAAAAARRIGSLDIAQAAVAVGGRVVAEEDAAGTDALLERVTLLRRAGSFDREGGVLVKCLKPIQDGRHDLPTIGPETAERARRAGLAGVAAEAGRAILVGREETIEAFRSAGLFLAGLKAPMLGHG